MNDLNDRIINQLEELDKIFAETVLPVLEDGDITSKIMAARWGISQRAAHDRLNKLVIEGKLERIDKRSRSGYLVATYKVINS